MRFFTLVFKIFSAAFFLFSFLPCNSQQIIRSSLSSFGNSVNEDGVRYRATVGQPSNTSKITSGGVALRQGFQQPYNFDPVLSSKIFCEFEIYPNPVAQYLAIYSSAPHNFNKIIIKDMQGRICSIRNSGFTTGKEIDVSALANGVYFVSLSNEKFSSCSKKLVILK